MFGRYINFKGFKSIPGIHPTYTINIHGKLKCKTGHIKEPVRVDEFGKWYKLLDIEGQVVTVNLAVLVSMIARNVSWPISVCSRLTMYFVDGDNTNTHPSNTIWRPFPKDVEWKPGIRYIPISSKHAISLDGRLYNVGTGFEYSWYNDADNYWVSSFNSEINYNKRCNVKQHRMLLLAFSNYPVDCYKLDINHIDANPANNEMSNLEWCTRSHNLKHAYDMGLRATRGVVTRDTVTGVVTTYNSRVEAIATLRCTLKAIERRCETDGTVSYQGLQYKYLDSTTPWSINPKIGKGEQGVLVKDIITDEITEYATPQDAAIAFDIHLTTVYKRCKSAGKINYNNKRWQFNTKTTWDELIQPNTEIQIKELATNIIKRFNSLQDASKQLNIPPTTITARCDTNGQLAINGYLWMRTADNCKWADNPKQVNTKYDYFIKEENGNILKFEDAKAVGKHLGIAYNTVTGHIVKNGVYHRKGLTLWREVKTL